MELEGGSETRWVAVIGDRLPGFEPQDSMAGAVEDASRHLGLPPPTLRWIPTELLDHEGPEVLTGASSVWCAPGSPFRSLDGALVGIRWARESRVPFLGTCAGFQHAVIEYARTVLGHANASHAEYESSGEDLFISELLCSLVGQVMEVDLTDDRLASAYGTAHPKERYYCRFGLNPAWRDPLVAAGLVVAGVDAEDGDVRIMRLADHPFFVITLFVPQTSSSPDRPHPLILDYLRTALTG
jgi:CTP synthase (UTP-ammonia lyase)